MEALNLGWLAQPCFWHFVGQRALEQLLGGEREGSTNCMGWEDPLEKGMASMRLVQHVFTSD